MKVRILISFIALLMAPVVMAEGIAGVGKHAEEPGCRNRGQTTILKSWSVPL